jgi:hypothetical protein
VICKILGMDEETVKAAFEKGQPPSASEEQLVDAVYTSVASCSEFAHSATLISAPTSAC